MEKHVCTGLFNVLFTQFTFFVSVGFSCIDYFLLSIVILSNLCNSSNILPPRAALWRVILTKAKFFAFNNDK